jgi:hypothetical protein
MDRARAGVDRHAKAMHGVEPHHPLVRRHPQSRLE